MTRIVWEDEGNVINSRMDRLAGGLTVMMLVELPEEKVVDVQFKLSQQLLGLNVSSKQVSEVFPSISNTSRLTVTGADSISTLHEIIRSLSLLDISVSDVTTQAVSAPMGGTLLFGMQGLAEIPESTDREEMEREMEKVGDALGVEVRLSDYYE